MAVELQKGQKVNLNKTGGPSSEILINLNWNQKQTSKKGFFSSLFSLNNAGAEIDLDLACLYELKNGQKGVVQALGNSFGNLNAAPFIALDADDRTGASVDGENLRINGNKIKEIKRILVFTFIYDGVANWKMVDGVVTVKCPGNEDIIVKMDEYNSNQRTCAIAMLENVGNDTLSVEKIIRFFDGHAKMDKAYKWNMRWVPGKK